MLKLGTPHLKMPFQGPGMGLSNHVFSCVLMTMHFHTFCKTIKRVLLFPLQLTLHHPFPCVKQCEWVTWGSSKNKGELEICIQFEFSGIYVCSSQPFPYVINYCHTFHCRNSFWEYTFFLLLQFTCCQEMKEQRQRSEVT